MIECWNGKNNGEDKMNRTQIRNSLLLLLTATIWGTAFVAQSSGMEFVGPFTFNCIRNVIGGLVLIPCIFLLRKWKAKESGVGDDVASTDCTNQTSKPAVTKTEWIDRKSVV